MQNTSAAVVDSEQTRLLAAQARQLKVACSGQQREDRRVILLRNEPIQILQDFLHCVCADVRISDLDFECAVGAGSYAAGAEVAKVVRSAHNQPVQQSTAACEQNGKVNVL